MYFSTFTWLDKFECTSTWSRVLRQKLAFLLEYWICTKTSAYHNEFWKMKSWESRSMFFSVWATSSTVYMFVLWYVYLHKPFLPSEDYTKVTQTSSCASKYSLGQRFGSPQRRCASSQYSKADALEEDMHKKYDAIICITSEPEASSSISRTNIKESKHKIILKENNKL